MGNNAWERAAYFLGNMAAYDVLKKQKYLDYAIEWANANDWKFNRNENHNTTNADNVSCGETYMDLMTKYGVEGKMTHMLETLEFTAQDEKNDYWWWIDTFYMALNFYTRMGLYLNDDRLVDKAYRLYMNSKVERGCYDEEEGLWFRDERFLANVARTLRTLPKEHKYYEEYRGVFVKMAEALRQCQSTDGFWRTSLLDPEEFDMPETSGTALNVLGMIIGIREGLLDESYLECVWKGFDALTDIAMDESGRIGWVQVVALKPGNVRQEATNDYAVGTYLLICKELIEYIQWNNE